MSSYGGYPGPEGVPPPPPPSISSYARDRFWSSPSISGSSASSDPWGSASNSYTPQLELSSFSNSNYLPYGQPNGVSPSGPGSDLTFSGPSPPNPTQLQPISYPPPPSPQHNSKQGNGPSQPTNGLNGSSHHHSSSSASNSPPTGGGGGGRSFSYLDESGNGSSNPTALQNGHPSSSGSSSTLLSLGGSNKNELINGHPEGGDNGGMYRGSNNGPNSRYSGESPIKSEPNSDYYQSYYQNYTPNTTQGQGQGQGGQSSYSQQPHSYYPQQQEPYPNKSTPNQSYDPYSHSQQQQHQQMYSQQPYPPPPDPPSDPDYGPNPLSYLQNSTSSLSPPTGGAPLERKHSTDSSPPSGTSPQGSYRSPYPPPLSNNSRPPPPPENCSPPNIKTEKRGSPPNSESPSLPLPLPPPLPKTKNGKDKKKASLPPPPVSEDKKPFPEKKGPLPAKKKRKKRTKPIEPLPRPKGKDADFSRGKCDDSSGPKGRKNSNSGAAGVGAAAKLHLSLQDDSADLLLDLEGAGGASGDYEEGGEDSKNVPMVECGCFPADEVHAEPGPFYTHLGAARDLVEMRKLIEGRTGFRGNQLRLEKVIYTGKEGKTSVGCPLAKWILRRGSFEEQLLFLVKHRKGHKCGTAWIVVCCVIWEGVPPHFSDNLYDTLVYKLNRFGIPTTRRSDTNEQRSCACQGVDPDTCGAAYSFGCAWSMFFNGCKYARSRNVRKFRLTEEHEESELEEKVQHLATHLAPLYERVAQDSYTNQIDHENEGLECRLGYRPGRPFSGVTACLDYCSHAHKDAHNMMNGCTVTVSLARHRTLSKPDDEQYHVLPLYKLDDTDEHGSKEGQKAKVKKGQLEILKKYPCKVRIRKVPLLPSRRRAKAKSSGAANNAGTGATTPKTDSAPVTPSPIPGSKSGPTPLLGEYSSGELPLPAKREKLFDERLPNGGVGVGVGGDGYGGESRFSSGPSYGGSSGQSLGHSFNDLPVSTPSLWNTHPFSGSSSSSPSSSRLSGLSHPSGSYFDHHGGGPGPGTGTSSSLSSLTELTNSTISRHASSSSSGGGTSSTSTNLLSSPGSSGGNPGSASSSGYSSMSPILPSFRNTFMTEAESLGLASASSNEPNSSSSPRSKQSHHTSHSSTPAFQDHAPSTSSGQSQSYYSAGSSSSYSGHPPPQLYHPQPHNPCLPPHPHPQYHHGYHSHSSHQLGMESGPYSHQGGGHGPSFPPSLTGWSSHAAAAAAAYSSNYAAASVYSGAYAPSNFGMGGMTPMGMSPISHHQMQYSHSPYHHPGMGSNLPMGGPSAHSHRGGSSQWGQSHQFNVSPFSGGPSSHPHLHPPMNLNLGMGSTGGVLPSSGPPPPPPPSCFVTPPKPKVIPEVNESSSDNEDCFKDPAMGGVAIALTHGSVILQCAKHEMHATTALKSPNRMYPSRICLIFYQHKSMNNRFHGWSEWEKKIEAKKLQEVKLINQGKMEASPRKMKQLIKEGYIQDSQ